ncbi:MAG: sigma-70 family RNA polymerase sigma factor [Bacteroidales bacterium]|nr:sigma-70 family RNA polymerase sigma factor [Bacteroidales bacterium]
MVPEKNETITRWVREYSQEMFRFTFYKMSDRESAEDVVQNTFLAALQSFSSFEGRSSPKTWLFSILKHKIMDYHREKYRKPDQIELTPGSDYQADEYFDESGSWRKGSRPVSWNEKNLLDDHDFNATLQDCLHRLPSKWFSAVQLKYLAGVEGAEIVRELEITPANFWQILHRAKLQLRFCLETNWIKK